VSTDEDRESRATDGADPSSTATEEHREAAGTAERLGETYVAALRHGLYEPAPDETLVGVVRRPTRWFHAAVDENVPALSPPAELLDEFRARREDLAMRGLCEEGAHNAAWDEVGCADRYREHLRSDDAREAVADLAARLRAGDRLALVCYENTAKKRCHRTVLADQLVGGP
jgi:hypothetical protein